ncbi:MAG TPA: hypothetical protein VL856_14925 [Acidimicrobiia bacterium]|nr:hypothetical protein [Acidimicrobiia bacterium]
MADVLVVAALCAFFALSVVFVRACERVVGPDLEAESSSGTTHAPEEREADRSAA